MTVTETTRPEAETSEGPGEAPAEPEETVTLTSGVAALLPFARPALRGFVTAAVLASVASVLSLVPFWAIYRTVDELVDGSASRGALWGLAAVALIAVVVRFVLFGLALWVSHLAAYDVLYGIRIGLAEHLSRVPLGYVTRRRSGDLKKVMGDDVERLELFLAHGIPDMAAAAVTLMAAAVWMFLVDWRMGLAAVGVVVPAFACLSVAMRRGGRYAGDYQRTLGEMNASMVELVRGMPVVKVFNRGTDEVRAAESTIREHVRVVRHYSREFLPMGTAFFVLLGANVAAIVPLGVWLWDRGSLPTADLLFFFIVGLGALVPVATLLHLSSMLNWLASGGNLVRDVLDTAALDDTAVDDTAGGEPPAGASVELRGVSFAYEGHRVLHDVSLRAEPGTITALVGPSGAGKSTVASLIARFWDVDEGAVLVGGVDVRRLPTDVLTRQVAVVFQDTFLFDDTVAGNLRMAKPDATPAELEAACRAARAHDFVAALPQGYDTPVGERGARLSGGERQRLTLARAILADAPVIVLDEATAFTDPENEAAIQDAIGELVAGKTVIMIAHRLSTIVGADQIVVLDDGRVVETGHHDDLLAGDGLYAQLWEDFTLAAATPLGAAVHGDPAEDGGGPAVTATVATPAGTAEAAGTDSPAHPGLRRGGVIRTVWALAGEHRPILARSIGYKAAQAAAMSLPVGVLVALIDRIRSDDLDTGDLGWATAIVGACVVAQWVFGYLANRSSWIATFEMFGQVRVRALDHLRRLPMRFFDQRQTGDTVTAVTQDINSVEIFVHEPMQQLIGAGTAPVVVFLALLTQDIPLAVATMASVVAAVPVFVWANRRFKVLAARRQDLQAGASSRMIEYVQGLPVIRAFRLAGERLERFRAALDDYRGLNTRMAVQLLPPAIGAIVTVLLGIPCVLFFGALWLFDGRVDAGTVIVFAVLVLRVYQPLITAAQSVENLRIADASLDRLARVLDEPVQPQPNRPGPAPRHHDVAFEAVTFGYDPTQAVLHDVSFQGPQGTMTAIVGPSGAGKSTVLHLLARFADVQRGRVTIGGVDVRDLTAEQLFDAVTVVFQDVYLFPGTIFDNIAFGNPNATREQVEAAARAARAHDFVARLPAGYETPVGEAGATLSGGERQRLSIARAILKDAPVVLLDEATAAIDPTNERHVQAALAALVRDKTLIVVAHRLSTIASADQILVLDEGHLVERGRHDDLLTAGGRYARLWQERQRATNWRLDRHH